MDAAPQQAPRPFKVNNRLVLSIALPMTIGFVSTPILGLTDTAVVGQTGIAADLAGLGVASVLFDFVFSAFGFIRTSTTALTAQSFGRNDEMEQIAVFVRAATISLLGGLVLVLLAPAVLGLGVRLLSPEAGVATVVAGYFAIRVLSSPMRLLNDALLGFVLGRGRAGAALALQTLLNGTNIVLSVTFGLLMNYGVAGVAWATVAAETVTAVAGLSWAYVNLPHARRPKFRAIYRRDRLAVLFAINRDILVRTLLLTGSFLIMARIGAGLGTTTLAANGILMNFFMVMAFFLDGMAAAAEQICGRALGAHDRRAFGDAVRLTLVWSLASSAMLAVALFGLGDRVVAFLTTSQDVRELADSYLFWMALTALTGALAFQMDGVFMGTAWTHEMRNMMIMSFAAFCLAIYVLPGLFGNHGIWAALNIFLLTRGLSLAAILPGKIDRMFVPPAV